MDDDEWEYYGVPLWAGSVHDVNSEAPGVQKSRLWDLKSTSKAACEAYDRQEPKPRYRRVGFFARRPR